MRLAATYSSQVIYEGCTPVIKLEHIEKAGVVASWLLHPDR